MHRLTKFIAVFATVAIYFAPCVVRAQSYLDDGPRGFGKTSCNSEVPLECNQNSFSETPGICPRCGHFQVTLPATATVVRIECWGTKTLPNPQASWLQPIDTSKAIQYTPCGKAYDKSDFYQVQQNSNVVRGDFRNWSG